MAFGTRAFGQPPFGGGASAADPSVPGFSSGYSVAGSSAEGDVVAVAQSTGESVAAFVAGGHDQRSGIV